MNPTTTTAHVLPLTAVNGGSLPEAGGKAANLGELIAAGLPVPGGFVISTTAYRRSIDNTRIAELIDGGAPDELRTAITELTIPEEIATEVLEAYRAMGAGPVAVRSSGTAEDLSDAAFAGQHDTFLNVVGDEALLSAISSCWASLWSDRVIQYRRERRIEPGTVAIAVIVQRMVQSDVAGVMFTANPVSGDRGQTVIDASPGLGEAVVSGLVTPDHYVVHTASGRIVESTTGRREVVIRSIDGGGVEHRTEGTTGEPVLSKRAIRELTRLGRRIQDHYGAPQDTEWCLTGDGPYIVQARPITAMPDPLGDIDFRQRVTARMVAELVPMRPYPFDVSGWIDHNLAGVAHFLASVGIRFPTAAQLLRQEDGVVVSVTPPKPRPRITTPFIILRNLWKGETYSEAKLLEHPAFRHFISEVDRARRVDLSELPYQRLRDELDRALPLFNEIMRLRSRFIPRSALKVARFAIVLTLLRRRRLLATLISSGDNKTVTTNRALEGLADLIRDDRELARLFAELPPEQIEGALPAVPGGSDFAQQFADFLTEHGHRESIMLLVSQPTWRDNPTAVLRMLKGMAAADRPVSESDTGNEAERELYSHPLLRSRRLRQAIATLMAGARDFTRFREDTHYYSTMAMPVVRRIAIEYGRRLVALGALSVPEDVFHLHVSELHGPHGGEPDAETVRQTVARRSRLREELAKRPLVDPRFLQPAAGGRGTAEAIVSGTPGSAGSATGVARLIRGPGDFDRLESGEILVAPYTNPTWTPLFARAAGVVVDTGSAMSHAAIVAREYRIPAVLGAAGATTTIENGTVITVNGDEGVVVASETAVHATG